MASHVSEGEKMRQRRKSRPPLFSLFGCVACVAAMSNGVFAFWSSIFPDLRLMRWVHGGTVLESAFFYMIVRAIFFKTISLATSAD